MPERLHRVMVPPGRDRPPQRHQYGANERPARLAMPETSATYPDQPRHHERHEEDVTRLLVLHRNMDDVRPRGKRHDEPQHAKQDRRPEPRPRPAMFYKVQS